LSAEPREIVYRALRELRPELPDDDGLLLIRDLKLSEIEYIRMLMVLDGEYPAVDLPPQMSVHHMRIGDVIWYTERYLQSEPASRPQHGGPG
jgi:hypothetical protein